MNVEHDNKPVRVLIADDHPVFRAGLRTVVQDAPGLQLVGEADDGAAAMTLTAQENPDVVLMDLHMPGINGVEATRRISASQPHVAVLVLSMLEDDTSVFAAIRAGARGYLLKGAATDDIVRAITSVAAGHAVFGPTLADKLAHYFTAGRAGEPHPFPELTTRERDILDLVAAGHPNPHIATRLALSEKTVRNNVSSILTKLRVVDRATAIVKAREAGLPAGSDHAK